jgi:putative DNA primase/helicase
VPEIPAKDADSDAIQKSRSALRIFDFARSIRGETLAETYLRFRRVDIEQIPELDGVLRFEAHCPFGEGQQLRCLIALIRDVVTDEPRAIQRTALASDGKFIGRRGLGRKVGGAIKLWPDAEVTAGLVVGEGLETIASAATHAEAIHRGTLMRPAWALLDRINLHNFPVLAGIEALTILVDQ